MFKLQNLIVLILAAIVVCISTEFGLGWGFVSLLGGALVKAISGNSNNEDGDSDSYNEDDSETDTAFLMHPSKHFGFKGGAHLDDLRNFLVI